MDLARKENLPVIEKTGRKMSRAYGDNALFPDDNISVGFGRLTPVFGQMPPHRHEQEIIYVLEVNNVSLRYGPEWAQMEGSHKLAAGDMMRFAKGECHQFIMEGEDSFLDFMFIFSVPLNHTEEHTAN